MMKLVNDIREANCITHGGTMHADEVFATAFLEMYLNDIKVYRTMEINPNEFSKDILIYDIGRGIFDHHQSDALKRENGITYSSFGLLWKTFGLDYLKRREVEQPEDVFDAIEKDFVIAIDADDNGIFPKIETDGTYKIKTLPNIIKLFNPSYQSEDDSNEQFVKAVAFAKIILNEEIKSIIGKTKAKYKVIEYYNKTENNIQVEEVSGTKTIYMQYVGEGNVEEQTGTILQLECRVLPDNATNKEVRYVYSRDQYPQVEIYQINGRETGTIIFRGPALLSLRIYSTDGTNVYTEVTISVR